jgi:hypothetical protein
MSIPRTRQTKRHSDIAFNREVDIEIVLKAPFGSSYCFVAGRKREFFLPC